MTLEQAIRSVLGQYTNFSGRARRSEYWLWTLAVVGASLVALLASAASNALGGLLQIAMFVTVLVPGLAVLVRRLHDTDRPAWWLLLFLVPFGGLVILVFLCLPGQSQPNRYGPSPKDPRPGDGPTGYGPTGYDQPGYGPTGYPPG